MTNPKSINEAYVHDGKGGKRLVGPGETVDLLPVELMEPDEEDGHYFHQQHFDFHKNWLGQGPYKISWIGLWPCGRVMLYLETKTSSGAGAYASDFMSVD